MPADITRRLVTLTTDGGHRFIGDCERNGKTLEETWHYLDGSSRIKCSGVYVSPQTLKMMMDNYPHTDKSEDRLSKGHKKILEGFIDSAGKGYEGKDGYFVTLNKSDSGYILNAHKIKRREVYLEVNENGDSYCEPSTDSIDGNKLDDSKDIDVSTRPTEPGFSSIIGQDIPGLKDTSSQNTP